MTGWKVWTAGLGTILLGVSQILLAVGSPESGTTINGGVQTALLGLGAIGFGHKIEKAR